MPPPFSKSSGSNGLILSGVNLDQTSSGAELQLPSPRREGVDIYLKGCGEQKGLGQLPNRGPGPCK